MQKLIFKILFVLASFEMYSQSSEVPLNYGLFHNLDRFEILYGGKSDFHTSVRKFNRKALVRYAIQFERDNKTLTELDRFNLEYIYKDNNEWVQFYKDSLLQYGLEDYNFQSSKPVLNTFYKTPANFFEINEENFVLRVNPVFHFSYGEDGSDEELIFQNTRGFKMRGSIDNRVYFYTSLFENQRRFPNYIEARIQKFQAIPGAGFYKNYQSKVFDSLNGWDYLNAEAYIGLNISKSIGMQMGHGNTFIGNGYHSLLLSDYAQYYFYLKFNTQVWKFHYQNIFAELSAFGSQDNIGDSLLPKKYMATHYLDFKINPQFSIGFFESVIFSRTDKFELQYLNPVIVYRTVESFLDSPDNILIGLNLKWNFKPGFQLYSQLIFDEFKFNQFTEGNGWWANKYGLQLGLKYINMFNVDQLDGQIEYNMVRPYTFAHRDTIPELNNYSIASYSHYNQPLAHPLGSNFRELLVSIRYQPIKKLVVKSRIIITKYGNDIANENWGGNILKPFTTRIQDYGNKIGQGDKTNISNFSFDISYMLRHNLFIEAMILLRDENHNIESGTIGTNYFGLGVRLNAEKQRLDY